MATNKHKPNPPASHHRKSKIKNQKSPRHRRGVVLLIVVSLLTLFILLGVTYTLAVSQYHYASKLEREQARLGDPPQTEADLVLGQILYDTQARTAIWGHSLLADLYGIDGVAGIVMVNTNAAGVSSTNPVTNVAGQRGQFLVFQAILDPIQAEQPYSNTYTGFSNVPDYYTGRVLTFKTGALANKSMRIARYEPPTTGLATFYVDPAPGTTGAIVATDKFLINGAPFNGTGFGYGNAGGSYNLGNYQTPPGAPRVTGQEYYALLPHLAAYSNLTGQQPIYTVATGGMDESYDAPDYQNMYLAMIPPGRTKNSNLPILPSFHRPELVNYWRQRLDPSMLDVSGQPNFTDPNIGPNLKNFFRQFIFRPMPWDHPNFSGSNPAMVNSTLALANMMSATGNWDIDNDGDGIPDSIWIDPGLPVITLPSGRRVKRLAAVLIKDLDGRINVNAHGNTQQYANNQHRTATQLQFTGMAGTTAATQVYLPRGLGMGPAEVDFQAIFGTQANAPTAYANTVFNRYVRATESMPGINGEDTYSSFGLLGMPDFQTKIPGPSNIARHWNSPPDLWGRGAMALDLFGQPHWLFSQEAIHNSGSANIRAERPNHPYEFQYDHARAWADAPYLPQDLERLLRFHDADSLSLQSRLIDNALGFLGDLTTAGERPGELGESHIRRELLTTIGSHIPVPPGIVMSNLRNSITTGPVSAGKQYPGPGYNSVLDLYYQKMQGSTAAWQQIVPFEFTHGELFNINRPIGNGVDDNGNLIADEPLETTTQELAWQPDPSATPPRPAGPTVEKLNGSTATSDPRLEFARHLYCLMMLLKEPNWNVAADLDGDGTPSAPGQPGTHRDTARLIAQWAVNVIDFRDADSIMTRFQYDPEVGSTNPQWPGTWNATATVWGVERPELLITETLAFHDRRTEDLPGDVDTNEPNDTQQNPGRTTDTGMEQDVSFDQRFMPQASCFIELYNPWHDASSGTLQRYPAELYTTQGNTTGVNLSLQAGAAPNASPVWRLLVVKDNLHNAFAIDPNFNPDTPSLNYQLTQNIADVDRAVYFTDPSNVLIGPNADPLMQGSCVKYVSTPGMNNNLSVITGGQYAVVGSAGYATGGTYITYVGRQAGDTPATAAPTSTNRAIVLNPGRQRAAAGDTSQQEVNVYSNKTPSQFDPPASLAARSAVAVPVDQDFAGNSRSFAISDPPSGYPAPNLPAAPPAIDAMYQPALDVPLDTGPTVNGWDPRRDGSFGNFKTVLLQRLADPTQAFNVSTNPYITIDRSAIDITSFNGLTRTADPANDPRENVCFQSFQRGGSDPNAGIWDGPGPNGLDINRTLWPMASPRDSDYGAPISPQESSLMNPPIPGHNFDYLLYHTLGFVNYRHSPSGPFTTPAAVAGAPQPSPGANPPQTAAFPWLTFNNRPFANPMELLLVPATNQYDLLHKFSIKTGTAVNEYDTSVGVPFGHLLNFFQSRETTPPGPGPQFARLFDFVHVPSPFVQADTYFNHLHFHSNPPLDAESNVAATTFRPPFHRMSRFRDPGRVNINTVFDDENAPTANVPGNPILQALFKGVPTMDPAMDASTAGLGTKLVRALRLSRQGYSGNGPYTVDSDPTNPQPSMFAGPFRAADASDLYPSANATNSPPVSAGFLRSQNGSPTTPPQSPALFASSLAGQNYEYLDAQRNPYFAYQHLQRTGNILSTQSNCFAVWVTIGYFEVDPNTGGVDAAHPDGFMLGQEVGADSGEIERHRAFYLIDRSIPVGFMPGSRMNTDDCVLVRRLIE